MARVGVLVIHGMGSQRPGFSAELITKVAAQLEDETRFVWQEIHWAYLLRQREEVLWEQMNAARSAAGRAIPLDWQALREFVVHNFGDALAYHRDFNPGSAYGLIHDRVSKEVAALHAALDDASAPIVVVAHSLGALIMSNYIWDRQKAKAGDALEPIPMLTSMVTFGCSIPLFGVAFDAAAPIELPGRGVSARLMEVSRWLNFLDRDDVLGWPLKPLYAMSRTAPDFTPGQRTTVSKIVDQAIRVGGPLAGWNPVAHNLYWGDQDLCRPLAAHLEAVLAAAS